jgi:periplasmic protein CpxP/Spy
MKKQFGLFALCVIFGAGLASAAPLPQDTPAVAPVSHRADPSQQLRRLTKRLNLSSEQQDQLLPILTDRQQQMTALLNDGSLSAQDRHAKARTLREDSDSKIKAVLNDQQKQQYQQMREHRRKHGTQS